MTDSPPTDDRRTLLALVLDAIIPPSADGTRPGAGEIGLTEHIETLMRDAPATAAVVQAGLAKIEELAPPTPFPDRDAASRERLLRDVDAAVPGFIALLTFQLYIAYYQDRRVLESLGLEPRPPHPIGYEMEPFDESLLAPVRTRSKLYRDA